MIVTNGSRLDNSFLEYNRHHLDWIAISIDSIREQTNHSSGRAIAGNKPLSVEYYASVIARIHQLGYGLKINTVVNRMNYLEDMTGFIRFVSPKRWKVFQALPMIGQNDENIDKFRISIKEFHIFLYTHRNLGHLLIPETNDQIMGSYVMVDPAGRFFENIGGVHRYSQPILEVGVQQALQGVQYDKAKFLERGGVYNW